MLKYIFILGFIMAKGGGSSRRSGRSSGGGGGGGGAAVVEGGGGGGGDISAALTQKRVKDSSTLSIQRERLRDKLAGQYYQTVDKLDVIASKRDSLRAQLKEGKTKVETSREYKTDFGDTIKTKKAEDQKLARQMGGKSNYVQRTKMTRKQQNEISNQLNELDSKNAATINRLQTIKSRLERVNR